MNNYINKIKIEKAIKDILEAIGEDSEREGLKETPERVARMCEEIFEGTRYTNDEIAEMYGKTFKHDGKDLVIEKDIPIFSYCEHHLALMYNMNVTVAYIPNGKVIGLSKISRIADMVGKRLQLQERIGTDIAEIMQKVCDTEDVAVIIEGEHSCMTSRGIKKPGTKTRTLTLRGEFKNNSYIRDQLLNMI